MIEFRTVGMDVGDHFRAFATSLRGAYPDMVLRAAQHATGEIRREVDRTFPQGRTGALSRSFNEKFLGYRGDVVSAASQSELVYARIQDEGGPISGTGGRHLAIPLDPNHPIGKWPRHYPKNKLFFMVLGGKPMLWLKSGGGFTKKGKEKWTTLRPVFLLKRTVTLRAKHYIDRAATNASPGIAAIMEQGVDKTLTKAGG